MPHKNMNIKMESQMLNFLNDNMHTIMPALMYARIRSCIEHLMHIHDFYIYYWFVAYFLACTNQKK